MILGTKADMHGDNKSKCGRLLARFCGRRSRSRRIGFVGTLDIDRGHFCTHGTKIRRELSAMMNGMTDGDVQVCHRRVVSQADEVNRRGQVFSIQSLEKPNALRSVFFVPLSNVPAGAQIRRQRCKLSKLPVDHSIQ